MAEALNVSHDQWTSYDVGPEAIKKMRHHLWKYIKGTR